MVGAAYPIQTEIHNGRLSRTGACCHAQALAVAQIEVNRAEAAGNWFQAWWRPLCGYVCVLGLTVNFLISFIAAGFGFVVPQADNSMMLPVLTGMLGLTGMRSGEKSKRIAK